ICAAHAFDHVDRADLVEAASGLLLANGIGSVIGPMVAATAMQNMGPQGLFAFTGVVHVTLGGFALWRISRRGAVPAEARPGFDLTSTAPTMVALDPDIVETVAT